MTALARLRAAPRDAGAAGLPELLVSMVVFSVVTAAVSAVFVGIITTSRTASVRTGTTADARIAMEAMTRSLRVAVIPTGEPAAITVADPTRVQLYSSLQRGAGQVAGRPTRVTYAYDAGTRCVTETQVPAADSGNPARPFVWTAAGTTKCLIRTNAAPSFTYYAKGSITNADGTTVAPLLPTSEALRATVVSIEPALDVQDPGGADIAGVIARDRVTLVNVATALSIGATP